MRSRALLTVGLGRRVLQKLEMDDECEGNVKAAGDDYSTKSIDIMGRS